MHQHHSGYKFMLTKQQRQRGISHYGSAERLRAALSRAVTSKLIATSHSAVLPAEHEAVISVVGCRALPACQGWSAVTHIWQGTSSSRPCQRLSAALHGCLPEQCQQQGAATPLAFLAAAVAFAPCAATPLVLTLTPPPLVVQPAPITTAKKLTVSVLGASISAGIGAEDAPAWVDRLEQYLKDSYGKVAGVNVTVNNGAVPGTTSAYMAACVNLHVPQDADIVIIEYSANDDWQVYPPMDNPVR